MSDPARVLRAQLDTLEVFRQSLVAQGRMIEARAVARCKTMIRRHAQTCPAPVDRNPWRPVAAEIQEHP